MTRDRTIPALMRDRAGAAAAEMALVIPLLLVLLLGAFELGHFFYYEHVVQKAVRDGARYAARQPMEKFVSGGATGTGCKTSPDEPVLTNTRNLVRTGQVASGGSSRLGGWTDGSTTVFIDVACSTTAGGQTMTGIYSGMQYGVSSTAVGAPIVTVRAQVPYTSLFGAAGLGGSLKLNARSQAAVIGI